MRQTLLTAAVLLLPAIALAAGWPAVNTPIDSGRDTVGASPRTAASAKSYVLFGDSFMGASDTVNALTPTCTTVCLSMGTGLGTWVDLYTHGRVNRYPNQGNFGKPGDTTAGMLARVAAVIAANPDIVVMNGGTNDLTTSVAAGTMITNLQSIYGQLLARGSSVIRVGLTPRETDNALDATQIGTAMQVNEADRRYAASHANFHFVDMDTVIGDPAAAAWAPRAGLLSDGLHPHPTGYSLMGYAIAQVINQLAPGWVAPQLTSSDAYDATLNPAGNLLANPLLTGTGGTLSGGCTGAAPTNWALAGGSSGGVTCAGQPITLPDGMPAYQITLSGTYDGAGGRKVSLFQTLANPASLGTSDIEAEVWVRLRGCTSIAGAGPYYAPTEGGVGLSFKGGSTGSFAKPWPAQFAKPGFIRVRAPRRSTSATAIQVPSAASLWLDILMLQTDVAGSPAACVIEFAAPSLRKVS